MAKPRPVWRCHECRTVHTVIDPSVCAGEGCGHRRCRRCSIYSRWGLWFKIGRGPGGKGRVSPSQEWLEETSSDDEW